MSRRAVFLAFVFVLAAGCSENEPGPEDATSFTLTGTVQSVDAGAEPEGVGDTDTDTDVDPGTGGDRKTDPVEPGAIAVETDGPVSGCTMPSGGYTVYFNEDTTFDPADTTEDKDFPDSLEGQIVDVNGSHTAGDDGDCVLVAESVAVTGEESEPDATFTPGPRPSDGASPGATG